MSPVITKSSALFLKFVGTICPPPCVLATTPGRAPGNHNGETEETRQ